MLRTCFKHHGCTIINEMKTLIVALFISIKAFAIQYSPLDSTYCITLPTCDIVSNRTFKTIKEKADWNVLKANVKKVYPYSIYVKMKLAEMDAQLAFYKTKKEKNTFIAKSEKELINSFESEIKKLTVSQGKVLVKLIDKETNSTTYQIIRERRGVMSSLLWQGVSLMFGGNLKVEFNKESDKNIEDIIHLIELGLL
jgi:hypothetical protein